MHSLFIVSLSHEGHTQYLKGWKNISYKNTLPLFCMNERQALKRPYPQAHAYSNALKGKGYLGVEVLEYQPPKIHRL